MSGVPPCGFGRWRLLCLGALLAAIAPAVRAEVTANIAMDDGALSTIRLSALPNTLYPCGFFPVRVRIENRAGETRTWRIDFNNANAMATRGGLLSSFTFTVPATTTQETAVFVPAGLVTSGSAISQMRGTIDGPDVANASFTFPLGSSPLGLGMRVAATTAVDSALRKLAVAEREERVRQAATSTAGGPGARGLRLSRSPAVNPVLEGVTPADPAQWPADWRTWSQFNAVLTTDAAWQALDPARQRALREWVAFGGRLILLPDRSGQRSESPHGLGSIITLERSIGETDPMELSRIVLGTSALPYPTSWRAPELIEKNDPMLDLRIGGRWLIGFLLGFAVLIGPVNLFYFAPVGRRHRLFLTVPLISVAGSLVLVAIMVLSDGWGGRGYRQALVVLLPGENEAVVVQQQVVRTGMILRRSFQLPADTDLQVRLDAGPGPQAQGTDLVRQGDRASGGWFASRAIQYHDLRRVTPTRARVDLVEGGKEGRAPVLQSSVGASLRSVRYLDEAGRYWKADELPPGRRITLQPTNELPAYGPMTVTLARGCFYAEGGPGDLAPLPTLASIRWTDKTIRYTGRVEEAVR